LGSSSCRLLGMAQDTSWTIEHFSQANPVSEGGLPALLRMVADSIEARGPVEIQDLILHTETREDDDWHSITVYFDRKADLRVVK
jgi:hypothetical protein